METKQSTSNSSTHNDAIRKSSETKSRDQNPTSGTKRRAKRARQCDVEVPCCESGGEREGRDTGGRKKPKVAYGITGFTRWTFGPTKCTKVVETKERSRRLCKKFDRDVERIFPQMRRGGGRGGNLNRSSTAEENGGDRDRDASRSLHSIVGQCLEADLRRINENFDYDRGTFGWGCPYCGELDCQTECTLLL